MTFEHLPLADSGLEEMAIEFFPMDMSPDEYAARFGHQMLMFSFADYRYSRPGLTEWLQRLGDILFQRSGAPTLRDLQERYLSPAEIEAIEKEMAEPY